MQFQNRLSPIPAPIKSISYRDSDALYRRASLVLWDCMWDSFENLSHSSPTGALTDRRPSR